MVATSISAFRQRLPPSQNLICTLHVSYHGGAPHSLAIVLEGRQLQPTLAHLILRPEALCGWERSARLLCRQLRLPAQRHLQGLPILVTLQLGALCGAIIGRCRLGSLYLRLQEVPLAILFLLQNKQPFLTAIPAAHCLMHMVVMQRMPP